MTNRLKSVDTLRALAIMLMLMYHLAYDLREYGGLPIDYHSPFWFSIGKTSALLFMFLSGFSAGLSKRPSRRGLQTLTWGMVITLITYLFMPQTYVRFGILHLLGIGMLLSPFLLRLNPGILLLLAIGIGLAGNWVGMNQISYPWLLPFGLTYKGFSSIDYYPLFPYPSATIVGILAYKYYQHLNPADKQHFVETYSSRANIENTLIILPARKTRLLEDLSKHSLAIYLAHQPLFVGSLLLVKSLKENPNHPLASRLISTVFKTSSYFGVPVWSLLSMSAALYLGYKLLHSTPASELQNQPYTDLTDAPADTPQNDSSGQA